MKARFRSTCPICKAPIVKGDDIVKVGPHRFQIKTDEKYGRWGQMNAPHIVRSYAHEKCSKRGRCKIHGYSDHPLSVEPECPICGRELMRASERVRRTSA